MIAALICVVLLASLTHFVFFCRSVLASASDAELSDHVLEVMGTEGDHIVADDFRRFLQLVRLCPEHAHKRSQIRAVAAYFDLLHLLERGAGKLTPNASAWAESERQRCSRFAAVVLDRSISSSRDLFTRHATDHL
jgi:hypothetical protein